MTDSSSIPVVDRQSLQSIVDAVPAAAVVVSAATGEYLMVNARFSELCGWSAELLAGRTAVDLGLWCSSMDRRRFLSDLTARGAGVARLHRKDETVLLTRWSSQALTVDGTEVLMVVALDITDCEQTGSTGPSTSPHLGDLLSSPTWKLTPREVEVAMLVSGGHTSSEIARRLGITNHAVTYHRYNIRRKLGLSDRRISLTLHLRHLAAEAVAARADTSTSGSRDTTTAPDGEQLAQLAHDINNLLMSITASAELIRVELQRGVSPHRWIDEIERTAQRLAAVANHRLRTGNADDSSQPAAWPVHTERTSLNEATVLVVDDDPAVRTSFVSLLERLGCTVIAADGGHSAIAAVRDHAGIDCILLDYAMPDMDGVTTLARIREHRPEVPVAIVSGHPPELIRRRLGAAEIPHVLSKPLRLYQLQTALTSLLLSQSSTQPRRATASDARS